jgi:NAD(P)-dependent dehydrogenase (short-subunit alcohol dehydrogenase family)
MGSKRGMAMNPAYVASKHGVLGLTRAIAVEMAPHGIRANCVIPGFIRTEALDRIPPEQQGKIEARVPQRRMGSPMELAEVACFLLSDAASHVTGQDWAVDGGVLESIEVEENKKCVHGCCRPVRTDSPSSIWKSGPIRRPAPAKC